MSAAQRAEDERREAEEKAARDAAANAARLAEEARIAELKRLDAERAEVRSQLSSLVTQSTLKTRL